MPKILYFPHFGPNRHSDKRVVECRLDFSGDQDDEFPQQQSDIRTVLIEQGVLKPGMPFPLTPLQGSRMEWYSSLFAQTALLLQQLHGHQVSFFNVSCDLERRTCLVILEHEDADTAQAAVRITAGVFSGSPEGLKAAYRQYSDYARNRLLSAETAAIIQAAKRKNIPCFQFDRAPLAGCIDTGFRVRRNGLLSLGYGVNSHLLDGTFSHRRTDDFVKALLRNPQQRASLLREMAFSPVSQAPVIGAQFLYYLLVINGQFWAFKQSGKTGLTLFAVIQPAFAIQALQLSERMGNIPVLCTFHASDLDNESNPWDGMVDFDLAPDFNRLMTDSTTNAGLLAELADALIEWLYPDSAESRIPVVAVTGTNGKTTTSRMLSHIFTQGGYQTGLVCTDGIFIDGRKVYDEDNGTFQGHARVLTNRQVSAAVLETHHRGIAVHGFAFHRCDVAICLNVTEEHLAKGEIETLEEMTLIKRALVERAGNAAILFADDERCMGMLDHMTSEEVCLVSLRSAREDLLNMAGERKPGCCVLERQANGEWIVLYHHDHRIPIMPVDAIPATFGGTADVNVSNAMHAITAAYFSGLDVRLISSAMSSFRAGQQHTPGRMNFFEGLPFRVLMDFAHNPDGLKQICKFADRQQVDGRKVIAFAGLSKRSDEINRKIANVVSGHFDFYFCKDFEPSKPPKRRMVGPFIQQVLIEGGIPAEATKVLTFGQDVIFEILDSCGPGDLLILIAGHTETGKVPGYIEAYKSRLPVNQ
jgi:UDP-N-acetylmuramyl tripeptide synthase